MATGDGTVTDTYDHENERTIRAQSVTIQQQSDRIRDLERDLAQANIALDGMEATQEALVKAEQTAQQERERADGLAAVLKRVRDLANTAPMEPANPDAIYGDGWDDGWEELGMRLDNILAASPAPKDLDTKRLREQAERIKTAGHPHVMVPVDDALLLYDIADAAQEVEKAEERWTRSWQDADPVEALTKELHQLPAHPRAWAAVSLLVRYRAARLRGQKGTDSDE